MGAVLILLVACTQEAARPGVPASAARTASLPRVQAAAFTCTLPVTTSDHRGGFLSFPSGEVRLDAGARNVSFYDHAYSRWLPVSRQAVSPDGSSYAIVEGQALRVVDLVRGSERRFMLPKQSGSGNYTVIDYATEGVYLGFGGEVLAGLWRLDTASGAVTRVAQLSGFQVHGTDREFWVAGALPDRVDRLDLSDGYRETWFSRPGAAVSVMAVDSQDHPVVMAVEDGLAEVLLLLAPDHGQSLFSGSAEVMKGLGSPASDNHGLWFGSPNGIYLYSPAGGLQKMSDQPGYPAGLCV